MEGTYTFGNPAEMSAETWVRQVGTGSCSAGTTTDITFASENLLDMAHTDFPAGVSSNGDIATPMSVTTRTATGITITHPNNSAAEFTYWLEGRPKLD